MAPIKFEENIKEKLDKRTIQPSIEAWNKLSARLNENKKRNNKPFWWLGIAASIIGVFFVASQFFNNDVKVEDDHKIVVTPEVVKQDDISTGSITAIKIVVEKAKNINESSEEIKLKDDKKSNQIIKKQTIIKQHNTKENIVIAQENNLHKLKEENSKPEKVILKDLTFEASENSRCCCANQKLKRE